MRRRNSDRCRRNSTTSCRAWEACANAGVGAHLLLYPLSHEPDNTESVIGEAIEKRLCRVKARRLFALHFGFADVDLQRQRVLSSLDNISSGLIVPRCAEDMRAPFGYLESLSSRNCGDLSLAGLDPLAVDEYGASAAFALFALVRNEGVGLPDD